MDKYSKLDLLVIEDEDDLLDIYIETFNEAKITTVATTDPVRGLEYISSLSPRALLMDFKMPRLTGIQVLEANHAKGIRIPIVVLATAYQIEDLATAFDLGVSAIVSKPFSPQNLTPIIKSGLAWNKEVGQRQWLRVPTKFFVEIKSQMGQLTNLSCGGFTAKFDNALWPTEDICLAKIFWASKGSHFEIPAEAVWADGPHMGFRFDSNMNQTQKSDLLRAISSCLN